MRTLYEELGTTGNPLSFSIPKNRINDYTYSSIQSLAFLSLFPYSLGDAANRDKISSISLIDSNQYLLKYYFLDQNNKYVFSFMKYDYQMHWAQNTAEWH